MASLSCCDVLESLLQPRELIAIVQCMGIKMMGREKAALKDISEHSAFCYMILKEVSRSFAAVVMQLKAEIRDAVCVFYLVLRALDTIEDDMSLLDDAKIPQLLAFHEKLDLEEYSVDGIGSGYERCLLQKYTQVLTLYRELRPEFQAVIKDICKRMGEGMTEFVTRKVRTVEDYNDYCFYVAGLVGYGLSDMFTVEGCSPGVGRDHQKSMGLFLQKVNICRDYLEDQTDPDGPRCWWPEEIYKKHAESLEEFLDPSRREAAVACLNDMVYNALEHVPHVLAYLDGLGEPSIFAFSAIPQVMAIATLAEVYGNPSVFEGKVKIRKGTAARVLVTATTMENTKALFAEHLATLRAKVGGEGPEAIYIDSLLEQCRA